MTIGLLKIFALIIMIFDHVGEFLPNSPAWLRYIGRISAPLFFYCSAWGFYYTHNRKIYLIRLYFIGIIMGLGNMLISHYICDNAQLTNNIFPTILLGCIIIYLIERARHSIKKFIAYGMAFTSAQVFSFFLCILFAEFLEIPQQFEICTMHYFYGTIFGNIIFVEGSFLFVFYFVCVYFLKNKTILLTVYQLFFSGLIYILVIRTQYAGGPLPYLFPYGTYQWLMLLAIPFFFLYNGKRGKNPKLLFYIFYPLHIWILFVVGYFITYP